ncbi:FKBP-type peptidyl-prolyl cis-trans isomerase [Elongatibacter sediminis]|uniref:Peptidyl-prolyl cis-trans isomerase n=1 Tax=Elongatibacter sediminis TaxID=3119006 RepID=A0AAW9RGT4_9GAMM
MIQNRVNDSRRSFRLLQWLIVACLLLAPSLSADTFRGGAGGMRIKDLQSGSGEVAAEGMIATIHFTGWLDDRGARGREVYNSRRQRGEPVSFVIGTDGVMPAWNEGVLGMRPGGRRLLLVPPGMAWGERAIEGVVPANAAMQFTIELIRLEPGNP